MVLSFDTIEMPLQELRAQETFDALLSHFPGIAVAMADAEAMALALGMPQFLANLIEHMPQIELMGQPEHVPTL